IATGSRGPAAIAGTGRRRRPQARARTIVIIRFDSMGSERVSAAGPPPERARRKPAREGASPATAGLSAERPEWKGRDRSGGPRGGRRGGGAAGRRQGW